MKWFLVIVVVLNLLVGGYGMLKQKPAADLGAQDLNAAQLKILPAGWTPAASAPVASHTELATNLDASAAKPLAASVPQARVAAKPDAPAVVSAAAVPATPQAKKPAADAEAPVVAKKPVAEPVVAAKKPAAVAEAPLVVKKTAEPVAAKPAPAAGQCLAWGALDPKQLLRVQGGLPALKLAAPQAMVKDEARGSGKAWVFYPPLATQAETQTLVAELKGKGFDSYIVKNDGAFKGHLSLGLFAHEAGAQALLARLKAAGYDKGKIDTRSDAVKVTTLSFRDLDAAQAARLKALQQRLLPGIPVRACS